MTSWTAFLVAHGAVIDGDRVTAFAAPSAGTTSRRDIVVPLLHLAMTRISGADAVPFLQGQLTCDVAGREPDSATLGAYCTPKGRMLATFIALRERDAVRLLSARDVVAPLAKRLRMFVLRSKVVIEDESDAVRVLGIAGPRAAGALTSALGIWAPDRDWHAVRATSGVVALRVPADRFVLLAPATEAERVWEGLVGAGAQPAETAAWERLDIERGIPWVVGATQEQFIPQMANLELIGGVSFEKGCYPGQEIVARTHYRGEVKRRLRLARVESESPPAPGDELFVGGTTDQTCGMVVNAAPALDGGYDLLAVVQNSALVGEPVRLRAGDGPKLVFRDLPYAVP